MATIDMTNISKETKADIRKKIEAGSFRTDGDVYDYAEGHGLPARDVDKAVWEIISKNTPCHGWSCTGTGGASA